MSGVRSTWNGPAGTSSRMRPAASLCVSTRLRSGCARSAAVTWRRRSTTWNAPGTQDKPGLANPNVVPFAGDLAEALARVGAAERAWEILAWLQDRADRDRPGLPAGGGRTSAPESSPAIRPRPSLVRHGPVGSPGTTDAVRAGPYPALRG